MRNEMEKKEAKGSEEKLDERITVPLFVRPSRL
jgi:hypothetical protein